MPLCLCGPGLPITTTTTTSRSSSIVVDPWSLSREALAKLKEALEGQVEDSDLEVGER